MLKLTKKVEYALIALQEMQLKDNDVVTNAKELSNKFDISISLLAKVLQQMARNNIIESIHGHGGGYKLNTPLEQIRFDNFIEIIEGPVGIVDCLNDPGCARVETCNIRLPIERINNTIKDIFSKMTLADITK